MAKKKNAKGKSKVSKVSSIPTSLKDSINTEVIAAAMSSVNKPVLMKVCRLCEAKDGPFLNIFDADKVTAKKIEELMPFWIAENDDLPHKICFRCSAKVEELHEFIQKCIKTQENLRKALGNKEPLPVKAKTRTIWEEKLNQSNMSNDDICDALIKKAMEGIKNIPVNTLSLKEKEQNTILKNDCDVSETKEPEIDCVKQSVSVNENYDDLETPIKQRKLGEGNKRIQNTRASHSSNMETPAASELEKQLRRKATNKQQIDLGNNKMSDVDNETEDSDENSTLKELGEVNKKQITSKLDKTESKNFNIMDHVSMIKVNGVGVLFQCKLCNRNFLKKEVVLSHGCAKNGVPKVDVCNVYIPPEPPKLTTVKYINTKIVPLTNSAENLESKPTVPDNVNNIINASTSQQKHKIGPASKTGRLSETTNTSNNPLLSKEQTLSTAKSLITLTIGNKPFNTPPPLVNIPNTPSLNSRYRLVPGPNNTFTLVDVNASETEHNSLKKTSNSANNSQEVININDDQSKIANTGHEQLPIMASKIAKLKSQQPLSSIQQPYPVGLFQTVAHHSSTITKPSEPAPFTTPAMKKQSYTIVQTGNPSKLLISTKPQPPIEEALKKRPKRGQSKQDNSSDEPFKVILEDTSRSKDPALFNFINVDPLLQPSYVLPTNNIIQESQITTSTSVAKKDSNVNKDKDKYSCNICEASFSREKKLLTHIQSHYNKMDDEDRLREKQVKRHGRKT